MLCHLSLHACSQALELKQQLGQAAASWASLPTFIQQHILVLSANPNVRLASNAFRNNFNAANDT